MSRLAQRLGHPPFSGGPADCSRNGFDFCTREGAHVLADTIRAAWARAGVTVEPRVEPISVEAGSRPGGTHKVVLPGFVNGLPVKEDA